MKALIQRVKQASVSVDGRCIAQIDNGILVLLGVEADDTEADISKLAHKVCHYRMFADTHGKMNLNVQQAGGDILVVSQFTLAADTQSGLRPSFSVAMPPGEAEILYDALVDYVRQQHGRVATGQFGADMKVSLENDGPVTFLLRS